jgi:hypothetical protein
MQDELTDEVLNAIAGSYVALFHAELAQARRKPPASLDAYDCVLRVYDYLQFHSGDKHLAARDCLELVVDEETDYVDALDWEGDFRIPLFLAAAYGQLGWVEEAAPALAELEKLWTLPAEDLRAELTERQAIAPEITDRLIEGLAKAGMEGLSEV